MRRPSARVAADDPPPAEGIDGNGSSEPPSRTWRPSDMRLLEVWHTPGMRDYRVEFFNTFARNRATYRVCQRSIVVREACCPEHARTIAELRFAELEGVSDWRIRAAEVEVVPIEPGDGEPGTGRTVLPQVPERAPADAKPFQQTDRHRRIVKQDGSGKRSA